MLSSSFACHCTFFPRLHWCFFFFRFRNVSTSLTRLVTTTTTLEDRDHFSLCFAASFTWGTSSAETRGTKNGSLAWKVVVVVGGQRKLRHVCRRSSVRSTMCVIKSADVWQVFFVCGKEGFAKRGAGENYTPLAGDKKLGLGFSYISQRFSRHFSSSSSCVRESLFSVTFLFVLFFDCWSEVFFEQLHRSIAVVFKRSCLFSPTTTPSFLLSSWEPEVRQWAVSRGP